MNELSWVERIAIWLPKLALPSETAVAGQALFELEISGHEQRDDDPARGAEESTLHLYAGSLESLTDQLAQLIPAWIDRLIECLATQHRTQHSFEEAVRTDKQIPQLDVGSIMASGQLIKVLAASGERIDPHLDRIIAAVDTMGRDADEHLCEVLEHAGPRLREAVPTLLNVLRQRGVWCWPSHLALALARASAVDARVLREVRALLSSEDEHTRQSAIQVLSLMGERAQPAAEQLLAFRTGSEAERCQALDALAHQGTPTPATLDLIEEALRDNNGYVRRAAVWALAVLRAEPDRFIPFLIDACDDPEYLHDTSLPESAVNALGQYGPEAQAALPRLRRLLEGPIKQRTVDPALVRKAIQRISLAHNSGAIAVLGEHQSGTPPRVAKPPSDDEPLFPVIHQGQRCFIDRSGRIAVETKGSWGKPFSDGRAIVHADDATFVIDRRGHIVFESPWDAICPFSEGLSAVLKDKKWGFVDRDGRVVIEPRYDSVTPFSEGLAGVELWRKKDISGELITYYYPGKFGFINRLGQVVVPINWTEASTFHAGRAAVCTGGMMKPSILFEGRETLSDRTYGYIDSMGHLVINGIYAMAGPFCDGLAAIIRGKLFGRSRAGYIDVQGNEVIPAEFTSTSNFRDGLAIVQRRGRRQRLRRTVIDRTGKVVLETDRVIEAFSEGLAAAVDGSDWGFVDLSGQFVIPPQFDQCEPFQDGLAEVQRGKWYGLIDHAGRFVWGPTTEGCVSRVSESEWT